MMRKKPFSEAHDSLTRVLFNVKSLPIIICATYILLHAPLVEEAVETNLPDQFGVMVIEWTD